MSAPYWMAILKTIAASIAFTSAAELLLWLFRKISPTRPSENRPTVAVYRLRGVPSFVRVCRQVAGHVVPVFGQKPFRCMSVFAIEAAARHNLNEATILEHLQSPGGLCFPVLPFSR